jgi:hypothetical protein
MRLDLAAAACEKGLPSHGRCGICWESGGDLGLFDEFFRILPMMLSQLLSDLLLSDIRTATGGWLTGWQLICILLLVVLIIVYFVVKKRGG